MTTFTFKGAHWSDDLLDEWFELWSGLWALGVKWEWKRGDSLSYEDSRIVYRLSSSMNPEGPHSKKWPIPLPSWSVIQDMAEWTYSMDSDLYQKVYEFSHNLVPNNNID